MSIFNFFKKKANRKPPVENQTIVEVPVQRGIAVSKRIELHFQNEDHIRNCYIAFDVETTGLNPTSDRIVEIGAAIFQNGTVQKVFSSLVNPGIPIPPSASAINHITNAMLDSAPSEGEVYPKLVDFLGDALRGEIIMCAHNASFDFNFLCNTLSRLGFNANIEYLDTLSLSRKYLHGLENYKQCTIENYFGLINPSSHRAASDAENCGHILYRLIDIFKESLEMEKRQIEKSKPNPQELEVCAFIQNTISHKGGETIFLRFRKNSSGYVDVCCLYNFLKFKFAKKGAYILIKNNCPEVSNYVTEPCIQSEGGTDFVRVYFSSPFDLELLSEYIYKEFLRCYESMNEYASFNNSRWKKVENSIRFMYAMKDEEVSSLLNKAKEHSYAPTTLPVADKQQNFQSEKQQVVKKKVPHPQGRAILQMDDNGIIIKEFDSIAAAAREIGVSSRCIRDAANGVQKRAGGFHWMYKV